MIPFAVTVAPAWDPTTLITTLALIFRKAQAKKE